MSWGYIAFAAMMAALVVAYLQGVRSYGLGAKRMVMIALIWVAIIGVGYLIASLILGST